MAFVRSRLRILCIYSKTPTNPSHDLAFEVQGPDEIHPSAAPSRPPSRSSNNRSPLSKVVDLTTDTGRNSFYTEIYML